MGRKITNVGWCWTPRCEVCDVCTGRRTLLASIAGVIDNDCPDCEKWFAEHLRMTQDPAGACGWLGERSFCSGRVGFGLEFILGVGVLMEFEIFEIATTPPQLGQEVFIGDVRFIAAGVRTVNCDFRGQALVPIVPSAYVIANGWQQCNWAGVSVRMLLADCVNTET